MSLHDVIFDLDGTLVDSVPGIAWSVEAALSECGLNRTCASLRALIGPPIREILATLAATSDARLLDWLEAAFRASYDSEGWRRTACFAGIVALLDELQASGLFLWVVTNKPTLATGRILESLRIRHYFNGVFCRDLRTPPYMSKCEVLHHLIKSNSLVPARCLMIGDTLEDARAAKPVGIPAAIVSYGYGRELDALPVGCLRVENLDELAGLCYLDVSRR